MISGNLKDICLLASLPPGIKKALDFLLRPEAPALPDGRCEIEGDSVFALVQRYTTAALLSPKFEVHRKYIDVQYVAQGLENIGCAPLAKMRVTEDYDPRQDICFGLVADGGWAPVTLRQGELAILYPEDAHAPRLACKVPAAVMKIVVKVAV
ncbi:MAG: hypothetical protein A2234_08485 [Elusimicrobia bacterium RIFOXYA2_FULL_58_8]|nr:MAG: hypothetical protein A2234_08485 [Elusimicrobia bacterium RIFOXYA2_FULL_58_8]OGS12829.1 MAG: hypothetical protein A2285_03085 [Elusimicrobia bacterium RIFOXYA12_FULL_57_11]